MRKCIIQFIIFIIGFNLFANEAYITSYRNASYYFESNDYGKALTYAEDAITLRKTYSDNQLAILKKSMTSRAVKSAGDNINNILKILENRNEYDSINVINHYLKIKGEDFFNNSISLLLNYISEEASYPEAQFLIGKIYKIEGEYSIAETYYQMAYENKDALDIPDIHYEILYELAEISKLQKDDNKYEARLLNILLQDKYSNDVVLNNAIQHTISNDKNDSVEKFFQLYRAKDFNSLKAYLALTEYYNEKGYMDKALKYSTLAVLTGFTKICEVIESRDSNFEYYSFKGFLEEVNNYNDIVQWGIEEDFWKSFNDLSLICKKCGYINFSRNLLQVLVKNSPQEYWQKEAVLQLSNL